MTAGPVSDRGARMSTYQSDSHVTPMRIITLRQIAKARRRGWEIVADESPARYEDFFTDVTPRLQR